MKNGSFYLPILKWKAGEKKALKELNVDIKTKVIPLAELVPKEDKEDLDIFSNEIQFIKENFSDMAIFVDTKLLTDLDRENAVVTICQKVNLFEDKVRPAVYLSELENKFSQETKDLLKEKGFCLRVFRSELKQLRKLEISSSEKQKIHLVIDFEVLDENINTVVPLLSESNFCEQWESISLASGAFPKDLMAFSADKVESQSRGDWLAWKAITKQLNGLNIYVNYGDYTIRHPIFKELSIPNTSCSFRYTGDKNWFIFRGFSRKSKHYKGFIQYRAHAVNLVENDQYQFSGEDFSSGDLYIKSKAQLVDDEGKPLDKKCGNSTTWLQAGVNHHICKVVDQLNNQS